MKKSQLFLLLFSLSLIFAACSGTVRQSEADHKGVLIVASKNGDDVYFIDRATGDVLVVLPTDVEPHEVEVSDDGRLAVVCNYGNREQIGQNRNMHVAFAKATRCA